MDFCLSYSPVNEKILCLFVTFLAIQGFKAQTIKCYLSGVWLLQIAQGFPDPQIGPNLPQLEGIIKGVKHSQVEAGSSPHTRLPITPDILSLILPAGRDGGMIWSACCIGFFGFLRTVEFYPTPCNSAQAGVQTALCSPIGSLGLCTMK